MTGRRPTALSGLALYLLASIAALFSGSFSVLLAALLLGYAGWQLPETRPQQIARISFFGTLGKMTKDPDSWHSALLVALFNICMFSYYQLASFHFAALELPAQWLGYTGLVLASGSVSAPRSTRS
ncbi:MULTISPECIES: hypothetical protein [unclassified Haematospirillum]|uniref:hypothetical protein n=1 Tax=unclassified Haematospirillum TaxID=2622088 RepID=UPI001ADE4B97|nr:MULTISPECIES: hypothetical protein [unclassified Haematospirillum]